MQYSGGDRSQRSRQGQIPGWCEVWSALGPIAMQRNAECFLHLRGRAGKGDAIPATANAVDDESLCRKPSFRSLQIRLCYSEARCKGRWGEPLVVGRRSAILQRNQQILQLCFLTWGPAEDEGDAMDRKLGRNS